ncbi:hypothetical protein AB0D83_14650 [Streptomyces decoyicus]|uniref:hypothetical protein n=1 Tax=Streptomyces decoyicus TaxID=249567 RepID=UPI0033BFD8D8
MARAAPASAALACLRRYTDDRTDAAARQSVRDRAAALTGEHLGTDVEAWSACLQLLPAFAGTLPELVAAAGEMTR